MHLRVIPNNEHQFASTLMKINENYLQLRIEAPNPSFKLALIQPEKSYGVIKKDIVFITKLIDGLEKDGLLIRKKDIVVLHNT